MKGISRRARACAVVALTGATVLATAGMANAQRPANAGDGVPTGQGSVQMFNFGGFINNGGGVTGGSTGGTKTAAELGIIIAPAADGTQCNTSQPNAGPGGVPPADPPARLADCRNKRLDALFAFLSAGGLDSVEMFGWSGFPANSDIAGLTTLRGLLDKNNLRCTGWHGSMTESDWPARVNAAKILGCDSIGSGGFPNPGVGTYDNTLRTVETVTRLGKYSVEAGVGPVYWHNHRSEFQNRFVDNGVRKTSWQILMERIDARYGFAEIDAGWASDAYDDVTGTKVAGLINQFPNTVKMLHIKDIAANIIPTTPPASGDPLDGNSSGSPVAFGTGTIDYRPIFAAAANRVLWYHAEQDGGSLNDMSVTLANLKGINGNVKGTVSVLPPAPFASVAAGTPAADNVQAITVKNTGDAPLTITAAGLQTARTDEAPGDFALVSNTCIGTGITIAPNATCVVNVGFKPTVSNKTSVARVRLTSSGDDAMEMFTVVGKSTGSSLGGVGGSVDSVLSLTLGAAPSFGSFVPATARNYDAAMSAGVVSTAGNAILSVTDASATAPGHLVNGTFSLPSALQVRAINSASPTTPAPAFQPLSETAGGSVALLLYTAPTAGSDPVTVGFRQAIGATDVLRSGSYTKTLTFTLATTAP